MTQQINLLDRALLPVREWCSAKLILGLGALLVLGSAAQLAYEQFALKSLLATEPAAATDAGIAAHHPLDAPLAELQARVAANERLLLAVGSFIDLPRDNAARLRSLIATMPGSLWLNEVEFNIDRGVRVAGGALDPQALAGFSGRLGAEPAFRGLPLHVFALQPGEHEVASVEADVASGAPPTPPHYGFVLSSIDAERGPGRTP
jgi:hypothetical protein